MDKNFKKYLSLALGGIAVFAAIAAGLSLLAPTENTTKTPHVMQAEAPLSSQGQRRVITVRALRNHWNFDPKIIEVRKGDHVVLKIFNEDTYDHGFASEGLGINKRLPAGQETVVEFDAATAGIFPLYCSIPCGQGHFQMTGRIVVEE